MWEFGIYNENTKERDIIFGYTIDNAFNRCPSLNRAEWVVEYSEYVD